MKTLQISKFLLLLFIYVILNHHLQGQSDAAAPVIQRHYRDIHLSDGAVGPESIVFDCKGEGPYVGVSDGRILKWQGRRWTDFAYTCPNWTRQCSSFYDSQEQLCGRPLGLKFDPKTCKLYIADAYYGLMVVGRHGGKARSLAKSAQGVPFRFTNALDIDVHDRLIYFTDSSTRFQRWEFVNIIDTGDRTGRLMKYDMRTGAVEVLLRDISFANGVALSKKRDFLLVTETTIGQIRRYWLTGSRSGTSDMFLQLGACPDNINKNENGEFWIAQVSTSFFSLSPFPTASRDGGSPVKVDELGNILDTIDSTGKDNTITTSEVKEFGGKLWIGSVVDDFIEVTE